MPKNRIIYNQIGVFTSNAPSSGYHFLDTLGRLTNNDSSVNRNLVFPLNRINQASYGFNENRTNIISMGNYGKIASPITNHDVIFSLNYWQMGLINEARLGLVFNHVYNYGITGDLIYGNNGHVLPISGFLDRSYQTTTESDNGFPLSTREPRNIFVATKQDGLDLNDRSFNELYKSNGIDIFAFGDCYLTNYNTSCSIGQLPQCSVDFICNNIEYYNNGSGKNIPSVNPKDFTKRNGITYNLPNNFEGTGNPTVLLPQDISIDIVNLDGTPIINPLIDFADIKIQSYNINLDLSRESLHNIGYRVPIDRRVNLPVYANLDFNVIVGDLQTGSLVTFIKQDKEYNINLKLNYQSNTPNWNGTAILYQFLGAKFQNIVLSETTSQRREATFSFATELNPQRMLKGFFISGQLGIPSTGVGEDVFLGDDFFGEGTVYTFLTEAGDRLLLRGGFTSPIY